jgi:two-component system chemotaxis response regulator CheB
VTVASRKISVLVVDDSAFIRRSLRRMLSSDPMIQVVGDSEDGLQAVEAVHRLKPDVVTLDVKMPVMDGLAALERIMRERPTPVIMISSLTGEGGDVTIRALAAGAVDFIDKSSCHTMLDIIDIADTLVQKIKVVAGVDVSKIIAAPAVRRPVREPKVSPAPPAAAGRPVPGHLVLIGSSTGGPMALEQVLTRIPGGYPGAILVVQHMPVGFTRSLAERLNTLCRVPVKEAEEDDVILPGRAYIAPAGYHMTIAGKADRYQVILSKEPSGTVHRPSVDVLFEGAATAWPGGILALVMTGMGNDGLEGARVVRQRGGTVIAQDEATCVVYGMPRAVVEAGLADSSVPLHGLADEIMSFSNRQPARMAR